MCGSGMLLRSDGQDGTLNWEGIFGKLRTDLPLEFFFVEFDSSNSTHPSSRQGTDLFLSLTNHSSSSQQVL